MTLPASVKYTMGVVRVTPVFAPVWLSRSAGNGVRDASRPPVSRIKVGSIRGPTLRITVMPSAVLAMRVTTRCRRELPGRMLGSLIAAASFLYDNSGDCGTLMELQCGAGQFAVAVRRAQDTVGHGRSKSGGSNTKTSRIEILRWASVAPPGHVRLLTISATEPLRASRKLVPAHRAIPCGSSASPAAE